MEQKEYRGSTGTLVLTDTGVIIKRGVMGTILGGLKGEKFIPYSSIVAVQLKKAGMLAGYIQLTLMGGSEAKRGLWESTRDENTVNFSSSKDNEKFLEAKETIERKIHESRGGVVHKSEADDLEKFAGLRDKGVLTEAEFQAKKKQLLGL